MEKQQKEIAKEPTWITGISSDTVKMLHKGDRLAIISYDPYPYNPRGDDNIGIMICEHEKYDLGDKDAVRPDASVHTWEEWDNFIKREYNPIVSLPVYGYIHGGVTLSTKPFSCMWDSGRVGSIIATMERAERMCRKKSDNETLEEYIEDITEYLENEVMAYDNYLNGTWYCVKLYKNGALIGSEYEIDDLGQAERTAMRLIDETEE